MGNILQSYCSDTAYLWMVQSGFAQESKPSEEARRPRLGGPDAVENQMETDRAEKDALYEFKFLKPYFDWQARNKEKHGFSIGLDYTGVYLKASDSLPGTDDYAFGSLYLIRRWFSGMVNGHIVVEMDIPDARCFETLGQRDSRRTSCQNCRHDVQ